MVERDERLAKEYKEFLESVVPWSELMKGHLAEAEMSQAELAKKIDVTYSCFSQWMSNKRSPPPSVMWQIGKSLNLTVDQIQALLSSWLVQKNMKALVDFLDSTKNPDAVQIVDSIYSSQLQTYDDRLTFLFEPTDSAGDSNEVDQDELDDDDL